MVRNENLQHASTNTKSLAYIIFHFVVTTDITKNRGLKQVLVWDCFLFYFFKHITLHVLITSLPKLHTHHSVAILRFVMNLY